VSTFQLLLLVSIEQQSPHPSFQVRLINLPFHL
jgi:hypothetical protein